MNEIIPVILCGGSGTRLWPRSRAIKPKPFLPLLGERTLFQAALARCPKDAGFASPVVVTGREHLELVEEQLGLAPDARIIVEPEGKNTAAAIALAACRLPSDAVMLVCPSDQHIGNEKGFVAAAMAGAKLAREGWLVSIAIEATRPETGFGYLKRGDAIDDAGFRTAQFVEKPDREHAEQFLADGSYAWNAGIFAFRVRDFLKELASHRPAIAEAVRRSVDEGREDGQRFYPESNAFAAIRNESVDYAVMENTVRAAMVPADLDWSDIGNWQALREARKSDEQGNCVIGSAELVDCRNVMVESDGPTVSVIGMKDVIIVVDGDDILVTSADGVQKVGKLKGAANQ